jgi:hypothetical protein
MKPLQYYISLVFSIALLGVPGFAAETKHSTRVVKLHLTDNFDGQRVKISIAHNGDLHLIFDRRVKTNPVLGFAAATQAEITSSDLIRVEIVTGAGRGVKLESVVPRVFTDYCLITFEYGKLSTRWYKGVPTYY